MPKSKSRQKDKRRGYTTPPTPKKRKASPRWYGFAILGTMGAGVLVIVLNYMGLMPGTGGQAAGQYLWIGLAAIALGFVGATQWR